MTAEFSMLIFGCFVILGLYVATSSNVTDTELRSISSEIWKSDNNSLTENDVKLNINGTKLFTYVNEKKLVGSYRLLDKLFDNYIAKTGVAEKNETGEYDEVEQFLNATLATKPMKIMHQFLSKKDLASADIQSFKKQLRQFWFTEYSRSGGVKDSSGFEHVFLGETKKGEVIGFHNWLFAYKQEKLGIFRYESLIRTCPNSVLAFKFKWIDGYTKPISSLFIRASPEVEMALFTLCFVTRANKNCPVELNGQKQTIATFDMGSNKTMNIATTYVVC
ncbi:hypothetical protein HELRODRAFT_161804 [Helobdella robusta]|uniref:Uridylate-specific endoribonuclease n=1 Tax=Helobdella robusta TaxID=6412 RepID=T1ERX6_HELRO|nr:hypothetical protein HELRODRAFT_161804 [Helobdella robusta]ESO02524.1 hypothetical protein HELRODRAFT_161804 [Helobdella robusta]